MELLKLRDEVLTLFGVGDVGALGEALMRCALEGDEAWMDGFCALVDGDLSQDWLQMIWQYYQADRKGKKQDYTPACLARLLSALIGDADEVIDLCAGSGALTIQRWAGGEDGTYALYEIDDNVLPYLLFNLAVRNIEARVTLGDVLALEARAVYAVRKGERYGKVARIESTL